VTLNLDMSKPLRSLPRLEELVRAVRDAPAATQEQPFVEWKSAGDATEKKWRAELAKQVLGFGNRDVDAAAAWFGGCGYVLLGVAPGSLNGTPVHDSAKLESWLSPYVGRTPDGPEWISTYVEVDGNHVLVLSIEPPKWGDPIWSCHKTYRPDPALPGYDPSHELREGAIYVRHKASTEEHTADDLVMLQRRLLGTGRRLNGISVLLSASSKGQPMDASEASLEAWIERERRACEPPPRPSPKRASRTIPVDDLDPESSLAQSARLIAEMASLRESALSSFGAGLVKPDGRTREQYDEQVDAYLDKARAALPGVILKRAHERKLGLLTFSVRNETEQPIQSLLLEIMIPVDGVMAVAAWDADLDKAVMPKRPIMLGEDKRSPFDGLTGLGYAPSLLGRPWLDIPTIASRGPRLSIDNSGSARLTFDDVDLYPEETVRLPEVFLYANAALHAGQTVTAQWSARARNLTGVMRGSLSVPMDSVVPTVEELLAEHQEESQAEEDQP
jgi:hypothetical protein